MMLGKNSFTNHVWVGIIDISVRFITVAEIDIGVTDKMKVDWSIAEHVFAQDGDAFFLRRSRRFILVVKITAEQNHVNICKC